MRPSAASSVRIWRSVSSTRETLAKCWCGGLRRASVTGLHEQPRAAGQAQQAGGSGTQGPGVAAVGAVGGELPADPVVALDAGVALGRLLAVVGVLAADDLDTGRDVPAGARRVVRLRV